MTRTTKEPRKPMWVQGPVFGGDRTTTEVHVWRGMAFRTPELVEPVRRTLQLTVALGVVVPMSVLFGVMMDSSQVGVGLVFGLTILLVSLFVLYRCFQSLSHPRPVETHRCRVVGRTFGDQFLKLERMD